MAVKPLPQSRGDCRNHFSTGPIRRNMSGLRVIDISAPGQDQGVLILIDQAERHAGLPQDERELADLAQSGSYDQRGTGRPREHETQQQW